MKINSGHEAVLPETGEGKFAPVLNHVPHHEDVSIASLSIMP
jgi:hypothetical protein